MASARGAEVVEMALVLPLLLIFVFGTIDFGVLIYDKAVITNAAREGARRGMAYAPAPGLPPLDEAGIKQVVFDYCTSRLITFGPAVNIKANTTVVGAQAASGTDLSVTVSYPHQFGAIPYLIALIPGASLGNVTLSSTTVMRIE